MTLSRRAKVGLVSLAIIVVALTVYVAADMPIVETIYYSCPLCRASWSREWAFSIPVLSRPEDNMFSLYYQASIDPNHKHIWRGCSGTLWSLHRNRTADGRVAVDRLMGWDLELAIVKSLPDPRTRKAFCQALYFPDMESDAELARWKKTYLACKALQNAYNEGPMRKDWVALLHKLDFYPGKATVRESSRAGRRTR